LVTIRFDLTGFADKVYQGRKASERRNSGHATIFREPSPAIFKLTLQN
jgi:hypothetical protein